MKRVLFARVGYMKNYTGPQPGDPRPIGGGSYNKTQLGHEAFNFKDVGGFCYGYFQPTVRPNHLAATIAIQRIDPSTAAESEASGVTVVFFSTHPVRRTALVVGWYRNATVYRNYQMPARGVARARQQFEFNLKCRTDEAVLLDESDRFLLYETGGESSKKGKPGQSNAFYLLDSRGRMKNELSSRSSWIRKALKRIAAYDRISSASGAVGATAAEKEIYRSTGRGLQADAVARKVVEALAMATAKTYYKKKNYLVRDVSLHKPYDLECTRDGRVLRVEVKGTTTKGRTVVLTRGEVSSAREFPSELFLLHSISLSRNPWPVATGGVRHILPADWKPLINALTPIAFEYRVPDCQILG